jgi:hypothetical protein
MLEMESLSERQIATTLTEDTLKELMSSNGFTATKSGCKPTPNPCPSDCSDCLTEVDFCYKTTIPRGFTVVIDDALTTIQYNSCLFIFTDPCPCPVTFSPGAGCPEFCITLYPIRLIGGIEYRAFTGNAVGEECFGNCGNPLNGPITCEGSLCVNNILSYQQCPPTLTESQPKPIPAASLTVTVNASAENCNRGPVSPCEETVVKFVGSFAVNTPYPTPEPCTATCPPTPPCPTICPPCGD